MANFLESFTSGFAKVGSNIMADKKKREDELDKTEAAYQFQKKMDVQAEKDLSDYKEQKIQKRRDQDLARLNQMYVTGSLPGSTTTQANTLFNGATNDTTQLSDMPVDDSTAMDTSDIEDDTTSGVATPPSAGMNSQVGATNPTPSQAPVATPRPTQAPANTPTSQAVPINNKTMYDAVAMEYLNMSDSDLLGKSDPLLMAIGKAQDKISTRNARDSNLKIRAAQAGTDTQGNYNSYLDQNGTDINANLQTYGLSTNLLSPLLSSKGPSAKASLESALKANADFYYGGDANSYSTKHAAIEAVNDKYDNILGLSRDASTGLISGPTNVLLSKLGADSEGVAELNKMAAAVGPSLRPPGSGSSSDADMKLYLNGIADITSGKKVNEAQMMNLLNLGKKVQEKTEAGAFLQSKFQLVNPNETDKLFNQYWHGNEPFLKNDSTGQLQENLDRETFEDWLNKRNGIGTAQPQGTVQSAGSQNAQPAQAQTDIDLLNYFKK